MSFSTRQNGGCTYGTRLGPGSHRSQSMIALTQTTRKHCGKRKELEVASQASPTKGQCRQKSSLFSKRTRNGISCKKYWTKLNKRSTLVSVTLVSTIFTLCHSSHMLTYCLNDSDSGAGNTILIMCGSERTSMQLRQIISSMDECPPGAPGKKLMHQLLRSYFFWKGGLGKLHGEQRDRAGNGDSRTGANAGQYPLPQAGTINEALKRKAAFQRGQQSSAIKRRRQRGGSSAPSGSGRFSSATDAAGQASSRRKQHRSLICEWNDARIRLRLFSL